jgi:aminoglycoside 6'-N-acetyltransferase I
MIRRIKQADVPMIESILKRIKSFSANEINVAMELVTIAASNIDQSDYNIFVYEDDGKVLGYHCTGKRPLTDAVYDLYWIAADPNSKGSGIGKSLLEHAENFVRERNGRWIIAETSSKEDYTDARNFYLRNHYSIVAQINDFYSPGDNLIVFGKYFSN